MLLKVAEYTELSLSLNSFSVFLKVFATPKAKKIDVFAIESIFLIVIFIIHLTEIAHIIETFKG